jgi:hypothetical protein
MEKIAFGWGQGHRDETPIKEIYMCVPNRPFTQMIDK